MSDSTAYDEDEQAQAHYGENPSIARTYALFDIQRFADAEKIIRQELAAEPEDALWLYLLARAQLGQEQWEHAEQSLLQSLSIDPDEGWCYFLLSLIEHHFKNFSKELEYAQQACKIDAEEVSFLQRLAEAHLQNGEIQTARATLQQIIKINPNSQETFELLGQIAYQLDDIDEAEAAYRQALTFDPNDLGNLKNLAYTLMASDKNNREVIDLLFNILQMDPSNHTIADELHAVIRNWIGKNSLKGVNKQRLKELPDELQYFYQDYNEREASSTTWGFYTWILIWIAAIIGLSFIASFFTGI